ncbi:winged helix-turn-helix domain-containing protein [Pontibacillus marinus]|uniref:ArsR family transcriptional regulator n=1 Tax=Pontibacillus marinus BH030004 = DSM 16465 TaxID=1385511 RepID=A0A0A5G1Y6_9BACI|nr:winged helix-turn-helix domain-containing protein [Pontibacillus marinus]KGX87111.1 ArsR family transcriptional regulator [Pontibacillus marinus BH030004 = DSM 16465]
MQDIKVITTHAQLKALSDPFRSDLMLRLMEKPFTGQQLSEIFELSRARIHYHLKELEKNDLVEVVKKQEKNGIVQKFYQSTSRGFVADKELLPYIEDVSEPVKLMIVNMLERTKQRVISAPNESFQEDTGSKDFTDWKYHNVYYNIKATEEDFKNFLKKYNELMKELAQIQKDAPTEDAKSYFIHTLGFQVDDTLFEEFKQNDKE